VDPVASQASGDLLATAGVDALVVLPRDATRLARGARVEALLLRAPRED
jgi:molybdopterin biosynthesis enzyme